MSQILSECDCISRNIAIEFISAHANILKPQLHQCETIWLQKLWGHIRKTKICRKCRFFFINIALLVKLGMWKKLTLFLSRGVIRIDRLF